MNRLFTTLVLLHICLAAVFAGDPPEFGSRVDRGIIENPAIDEASGLAASRKNPGVLWTHNDSDKPNEVYAINSQGKDLGVYTIEGVTNRDWEDIAVGPGPGAGEHYLYIGDIGDNQAVHPEILVYRVAEPDVDANQSPVAVTLSGAEALKFVYPDGPRDAETLMVDPLTRDIYIVSKRETNVLVYRAPYPQSTSATNTLEQVATLNMTNVVGGDISPNGEEILIKTYSNIFYWGKTTETNLQEIFQAQPVTVPYTQELQGEAVCWDGDGMGYYTTSEELFGVEAHLYYYPRLEPSAVDFGDVVPNSVRLAQNYPNPFNPSTTIDFTIPVNARVKLTVYDLLGKEIAVLMDQHKLAGTHSVVFNAADLRSGVYFYKLTVQQPVNFSTVRRLVLLK